MNLKLSRIGALFFGVLVIFSIAGCPKAGVKPDWKEVEYTVFRHELNKPGHTDARISIVLTQHKGPRHGLIFYQTNEEHSASGLICNDVVQRNLGPDGKALKCYQEVQYGDNKTDKLYEVFTVGHITSDFCKSLHDNGEVIDGKKKAVASPEECDKESPGGRDYCICYEIEYCEDHENCQPIRANDDQATAIFPPDNGSGTGGGNNN